MATYTINLKQLRPKLAGVVKEADELYTRYLITRHADISKLR